MGALLEEFLIWMKLRNTAEYTQYHRRACIARFIRWASWRRIANPKAVTRSILEGYQRHLYYHRRKNGKPLTFCTQYSWLVPVRTWFRWLAKNNHIHHNPAADMEMPKIEKRLPRAVLSQKEAEHAILQPDISEPLGLRDRAILETFYSTGIRRSELAHLKLYNLDRESGTVSIWQGKGKKDRIIPIGKRAVAWVDRYLRKARPLLVRKPDDGALFVSFEGGPLHPDQLSRLVRKYIERANVCKPGACHMFRHTMATLMLENGADIRYIQEMLGHADLQSTQVYTRVSISQLKRIRTQTHPGAKLTRKTSKGKTLPVAHNSPQR
ncbi:MAG TPA: site-specific tyrosine recombinase XerC [Candidatus Acidoferrum sp.]|nr:site-specific tyrosine recombinase XerC [Candidatus Acidoferrum sp.]